jgi:LPS-assembly lipoprotein
MSWSEPVAPRRAALVLLAGAGAAIVGGCNLRPLHGGTRGAELNRELAAIEVEPPGNRLAQTLRNFLIDELNPAGLAATPAYTLGFTLERARNALAIQLDDVATRYDLSLAATFELKAKADGRTLYRSAVRRVVGYNVRREPFATLVAEQDAERRAAREVSRQIRTQLSLYLAQAAGEGGAG